MARENYKKIFKDKEKLIEMLTLYQQGHSLVELSEQYGCDHTSILYHLKKYKIHQSVKKRNNIRGLVIKKKAKKRRYIQRQKDGIYKYPIPIVNIGKLTYQDYLDEVERKKEGNFFNNLLVKQKMYGKIN